MGQEIKLDRYGNCKAGDVVIEPEQQPGKFAPPDLYQ